MDQQSKKRKCLTSTEDKKSKRTKTSHSNRSIRSMFSRLDVEAKKQIKPEMFSSKKCTKWFQQYAGADGTIDPEGMERFCADICVEPENIIMLIIAYELSAKQMGYFTYEEWKKGMTKLQCDGPEKVKLRLDTLRSLLQDAAEFKKIYRYAFDFIKEKSQRCVDIETSKSMLKLLLGRQWSLFPNFHQFLEESKCKVLNRDQWNNILEFSRTVKPDLLNYDADGAWPVIIDEFVEWLKDNQTS